MGGRGEGREGRGEGEGGEGRDELCTGGDHTGVLIPDSISIPSSVNAEPHTQPISFGGLELGLRPEVS